MDGPAHLSQQARGDPLKMDFTWMTRVLNQGSTILAMNNMRVKVAQTVLRNVLTFDERLKATRNTAKKLDDGKDKHVASEFSSNVGTLGELLEAFIDRCGNLQDRIEYEQQRVQTQLAVVYTFMAAKDNVVNIGLAADSKRIAAASKKDSSAMKTIAVLTMMFLPATFVAAIFAMPLFNWDAENGSSVFKARFKYYWAVNIPLTFIVILIWSLILLLPWKRWISWQKTSSGNGSVGKRDLGSILDNDSSGSLDDD